MGWDDGRWNSAQDTDVKMTGSRALEESLYSESLRTDTSPFQQLHLEHKGTLPSL
ncbi:hypothetical protein I79_012007 [Cricetulus griseus]|uniref:Uncharacterized protein n=1 Tax=Cricetulus griseus TaxID=10029 RepID=G3HMN8_CRIGR|nr:hypothetical protein I79_012007 [Cricetulus griseus]